MIVDTMIYIVCTPIQIVDAAIKFVESIVANPE